MVIVSNIYEVAFGSYSPFSTEMLKTVSSRIYQYKDPCLHPLIKHTLRTTRDSYGFLTMLKLYALLYLIHLCALQMHELLCLHYIEPFYRFACH